MERSGEEVDSGFASEFWFEFEDGEDEIEENCDEMKSGPNDATEADVSTVACCLLVDFGEFPWESHSLV